MMILRTLKRQPLYGYALVQRITRMSNDLLQIEEGSLYPAFAASAEGRAGRGGMGLVIDKPASADLPIDARVCQTSGARGIEFRADAQRYFTCAGTG